MKDAIIVGCGPAGVSAALYIARAALSLCVVGGADSALMRAEHIQNYYGVAPAPTGAALFEQGVKQLEALGIERLSDEVVDIEYDGNYRVTTRAGASIAARALLLCTGAKRVRPNIGRLAELEGQGVSYCAVCDAFFYRGKPVAVLGSGAYALHEVEALKDVVGSVVLLTNGEALDADFPEGIAIVDKPIESLMGDTVLSGVRFKDGTELPCAGLFVALGRAGASDLARKLGAEVRGADIVTDPGMATLLPGLYAAGDCTGGILQVSTAVAEGAAAALSAIGYLRAQKQKQA